jgi:hypothetical protein
MGGNSGMGAEIPAQRAEYPAPGIFGPKGRISGLLRKLQNRCKNLWKK